MEQTLFTDEDCWNASESEEIKKKPVSEPWVISEREQRYLLEKVDN